MCDSATFEVDFNTEGIAFIIFGEGFGGLLDIHTTDVYGVYPCVRGDITRFVMGVDGGDSGGNGGGEQQKHQDKARNYDA